MPILQGLKVVEISGNGAAGWATKHFADWGAGVTILEPAGGSPLRSAPPYYERDGERCSAMWQWLSRGKTAVRVGDGLATNAAAARTLCEHADVVIAENALAESVLGLTPAELRPAFDGKTVFVLISPFATDGPYASYRATDLGVNALGAWGALIGEPDREPLRPGADMNYRVSGAHGTAAALIALRHRRQGARPSFVDISQQAVSAGMLVAPWLNYSMNGRPIGRAKSQWPSAVVRCKDGWVGTPPLTAEHWEMLATMTGAADILELPGGREPAYRAQHGDEIYERVRPWFDERTRQEVYTEAQAWRIPAAPVDTVEQRLDDPQLNARGFFLQKEIDGREVKTPRVPYLIDGLTPVELGPVEAAGVAASAPGGAAAERDDAPQLPFAGIRIIDLTWFWSGPHATMTLGALGADVIKVESIRRPDSYRFTAVDASMDRWYERGYVWNDSNQNKRGLTLDLGSDVGMRLFERLLQQADVVISNFSNRVMPQLGLTDERLLELNPRLIVATMPGYGSDGPWADFVGFGVSFEQAVVGQLSGYRDDRPLTMGGFCDPLVGIHTMIALELALRRREQTGGGMAVQVPQCEVLDSLLAPEQIAVQHGAPSPLPRANQHEWMAPHNAYRVAGDDEWITIAVASDGEFAALAGVLGRPELPGDPRFATAESRKANEPALDQEVASAVRDRELRALERELQAAGVMGCRITKPHRLTEDEGLRHFGFFRTMMREASGTHPYKTFPFRFSEFRLTHSRVAPLLGEHNREILSALGVSNEEIARLEAEQVIGDVPAGLFSR
ncbi:MAG TPA: CoA transferase [Dehalococcoidia bacterium]|nr:CoA transferase [Dehalococcoidia bacterium]